MTNTVFMPALSASACAQLPQQCSGAGRGQQHFPDGRLPATRLLAGPPDGAEVPAAPPRLPPAAPFATAPPCQDPVRRPHKPPELKKNPSKKICRCEAVGWCPITDTLDERGRESLKQAQAPHSDGRNGVAGLAWPQQNGKQALKEWS